VDPGRPSLLSRSHRLNLRIMTLLDCEDRVTATATVAEIVGLNRESLQDRVVSFQYVDDSREPFDVALINQVLGSEQGWRSRFQGTCFFHLTRTLDPASFERGILPLNTVLDEVWEGLYGLVAGDVPSDRWRALRQWIENESNNHFADLYRMKVADRIHWGPHGILVLETAFTGGAGLHDYLGIPEIVEAIAICCGQRLGIDLATRFRESSVPCIVKFRTQEARGGLLKTALVYVHTIETGAEVGFGCNDGYATNGEPIPSEDILNVEVIPT
jgi:hypothetical protein